MTDQSSLLTNQEQTTTPAEPTTTTVETTTTDGYDALLQGITTPDGRRKYATASDAINSILPKEQHISELESENSVLRDSQLELKAKMEAMEAMMEGLRNNTETSTNQTDQTTTVIDQDALTAGVMAQIEAKNKADAEAARIAEFKTTMASKFGAKADEILKKAALDRGVGLDVAENVVRNYGVDAAFKTLGLNDVAPSDTNSLPATSVNATASQRTTDPYERVSKKPRAGEKWSAQREITMARLKEQGLI